jgi:thymidine kinase
MESSSFSVKQTGYLEIILGPMFSGKTSRLLEIYKKCTFCNISVTVINHISDKRYDQTMLATHDKHMIPCEFLTNLSEIYLMPTLLPQVILINEGQFFQDLEPVVQNLLIQRKTIYIAGLDGDFQQKKFGQILDLIPLCDKVTKLTSLCSQCKDGTPGIFSMRLTEDKEQTLVGSDIYVPVCRKCFVVV